VDHPTPGTGFDLLLLGYFVDDVTLSYSFDHLESRLHPGTDGLDLLVLDLHRLDPLAEVGGVAADMKHIPNLKVIAEFEDGHPEPIVIVGNLPNTYFHHQPPSWPERDRRRAERGAHRVGLLATVQAQFLLAIIIRSVGLVPALACQQA
jgi:hypothetical protein